MKRISPTSRVGMFALALSFVGLESLILAPSAQAYIDGGTASMIFQLAIASIVGLSLSMKIFWSNIKMFFASLTGKKTAASEDSPAEDPTVDK